MRFSTKISALSGLVSTAAAHGIVNGFVTDGEWHVNFQIGHLSEDDPPETSGWTAQNLDHGFVSTADYQTPDVICHRDAVPSKSSASVSAGGTVEFQWTDWPENHPGPVITYLANCHGDCGDVNKEDLKWVKIEEQGYVAEKDEWAAVLLARDNSTWTTNVPVTLAAGNYVFRHEIIGMYGKQHYPQCINIEITGDGTENPDGVVGTELYHEGLPEGNPGDPGAEPEKYRVPGPPVWTPGTTPTSSESVPSATGASDGVVPSQTAVPSGTTVPSVTTTPSGTSATNTVSASETAMSSSVAVSSETAVSSEAVSPSVTDTPSGTSAADGVPASETAMSSETALPSGTGAADGAAPSPTAVPTGSGGSCSKIGGPKADLIKRARHHAKDVRM